MAVKIRLRRMGQKKAPIYRIIVADSRSPRDGKCIEEIGTYNPNTDPSEFKVNEELAKKYLKLFSKKADIPIQLVQEWMPVVAASQSVKGNPEERELLLSWADVASYE